jgi:hypothetical protein
MRRVLFLALLLVPGAATAQTTLLELQPGVRVRVTAPPTLGSRYEATIGARRGDTLSLVREGFAPISVAISALSMAEVARGESRVDGMWRGAKWGAAIGLVIGGLYATTPNNHWNCLDENVCSADEIVSDTQIVALSTFGGAFYGGAIGALVGRQRWERLVLPNERASLILTRRGPQTQLGVHLVF